MGSYEAIKDGVVARKADNIEVMKQLLDAQKEAPDLEENRALSADQGALEEKQNVQGSLKFRDNNTGAKTTAYRRTVLQLAGTSKAV